MKRKVNIAIVLLIYSAFVSPSRAHAERAWSGSIHFVDVNMRFSFGGLEYGYWTDVGYLDFPGKHTYIGKEAEIYITLLPDQDNSQRSTIKGTIRLEVDGKKAELQKVVFVRSSRHGNWRIDPEIIKKLEKIEKAKRDAASKAKASFTPPPTNCGGSPGNE